MVLPGGDFMDIVESSLSPDFPEHKLQKDKNMAVKGIMVFLVQDINFICIFSSPNFCNNNNVSWFSQILPRVFLATAIFNVFS